MPIPTYEEFMLPLLNTVKDSKEYGYKELLEILSRQFKLTEKEKEELLPSGTSTILYDRINWANKYLKNACLIESTKRGVFKITKRGLDVLKSKPAKIDKSFLKQYPEFIEYLQRTGTRSSNNNKIEDSFTNQTPESLIDSSFKEYMTNLETELLNEIKSLNDSFFEKLALDMVLSMGYGDEKHSYVTQKSGDGGVDGKILEDPFGFKGQIYIQAKKHEKTVPGGEVRDFVGSLGDKVNKGIFITSSSFSKKTYEYIETITSKNIVLIDGKKLVEFMIDYNFGVVPVKNYELKKVNLAMYKNPEV